MRRRGERGEGEGRYVRSKSEVTGKREEEGREVRREGETRGKRGGEARRGERRYVRSGGEVMVNW